MAAFHTSLWRSILLFSAGVLGCAYAFSVVWYVPSTPDIGFHCSFTPVIKRVTAKSPDYPSIGDSLVQVGRYRFPDETQPYPMWAQVRVLRELIDLRDAEQELQGSSGETVATSNPDGQREILVKFKRAGSNEIHEVWCPLGTMPMKELVPSILWLFLKLGLFTVGALVFWNRPQDTSAAQFFLLCIVT